MKSFADLLSQHMRRAGLSDAELARTLGVRRQTIFRWREGVTQRPRERQDVLRIAAKLRLTPGERDELLLAAGFRPEEPAGEAQANRQPQEQGIESEARLPEVTRPDAPAARGQASDSARPVRLDPALLTPWLMAGAAVVALLLILVLSRVIDLPDLGVFPGADAVEPAGPGETLIMVSEFANFSGGQAGYNVAGRLAEALRQEVDAGNLADVRVEISPGAVRSEEEALAAGRDTNAALVVWGEYDSGRVLVNVTAPAAAGEGNGGEQLRHLVGAPEELSAVINIDLPTDVRWITLYALGRSHFLAGRTDQAREAFQRALEDPIDGHEAVGSIYFHLGFIEAARPQPDLSRAIAYYASAIDLAPGQLAALNNRGVAYLERQAPGDRQRAIEDFRRAVGLKPDFAAGQFNLGLALWAGDDADQEAALAVLEQAQALSPDAPGPNNALCWGYSLLDQPTAALPFCDLAVAADATAVSRDSRGLAYALLGRSDEAATEFQAYLDWLATQPPSADNERYARQREAWIAALQAGQNPFDEAVLRALRHD